MQVIYNSRGEQVGIIYSEKDIRDAGEGLAYLAIGAVAYLLMPFSPFFVHSKGKKDRESNYGCVHKVFSILICFFLGALGCHKFYEGKTALGILYYFTGGLLGIGWLYDLFTIIFRKGTFYNPNVEPEPEATKKAVILTVILLVVIPLILLLIISPFIK